MPYIVRCSQCSASLKVDDRHAGKQGRCPRCKRVLAIAASPESMSQAARLVPKRMASPPPVPPLKPSGQAQAASVSRHSVALKPTASIKRAASDVKPRQNAKPRRISAKLRTALLWFGYAAIFSGVGMAFWKYSEYLDTERAVATFMNEFPGSRLIQSRNTDPTYLIQMKFILAGSVTLCVLGAASVLVGHVSRPKRQRLDRFRGR